MGGVSGVLGLGGGASGTGFGSPQAATIQSPVTAAQANTAYGGVQNSMQSQQALLSALQGQNGLGNQNQVYNQIQGVANGTGPNPAQTMLNQSTGQNVANQAALMAGQRGASANAGLIARQAAQQGAATQQQAVGQGASLQAQQSLNALGQAGNLATTQAGQQIGQTNANTSAQQAEQSNLLNSIAGVNSSNVAMQSNMNSANAGLAQTSMQGQQGIIGGLGNAAGAGLGLLKAEGGEIPGYAGGAYVDGPDLSDDQFNGKAQLPPMAQSSPAVTINSSAPGAKSIFGKFLTGGGTKAPSTQPQGGGFQLSNAPGAQALNTGITNLGAGLAKYLSQPAAPQNNIPVATDAAAVPQAAPGQMTAAPNDFMASGGNVGAKLKQGGHVPGKPKVGGAKNSYANDTVKAKLSPGEIVIPRSITMGKNPIQDSATFVQSVLAKRKVRA